MGTIYIFFFLFPSFLPRKRNGLGNFGGKIKKHILCSVTFSLKSRPLSDNVERYCRVGQTTDDNMAHVHFMLDT